MSKRLLVHHGPYDTRESDRRGGCGKNHYPLISRIEYYWRTGIDPSHIGPRVYV